MSGFILHKDTYGEGYHLLEHEGTGSGLLLCDTDVKVLAEHGFPTAFWFYLVARLPGGLEFFGKVVGVEGEQELERLKKLAPDANMDLLKELRQVLVDSQG